MPTEAVQGRTFEPIFLIEASSEMAVAAASDLAREYIRARPEDLSFLRILWQLHRARVTTIEKGVE
ncbi:MAG: hypothetical protein HYU37_07495 [Acidobacteria bacterium]|nr:hypothetical protein [Acidobacteriota bacterium]